MYSAETLGWGRDTFGSCGPSREGQQGLIWHPEPLGLHGKSGSDSSPPQTLQGVGAQNLLGLIS